MARRNVQQQLKGAFPRCRWCGGRGCMACEEERRRYEEQMCKPIFTVDRNDPEDMAALRRVFGCEALQQAFGEGGGGIAEVEYNAAVESLLQALRKSRPRDEQTPTCPNPPMSPTLAHVTKEAHG